MARTKNGKTSEADTARFVFRGYVQCDFIATDKAEFKSWYAGRSDEDLVGDISALVTDGYRVSVGETQRGISATLANHNGPDEHRGYMLSAFAADPTTALHAVVYKHVVLLSRHWDEVTPDEDSLLR